MNLAVLLIFTALAGLTYRLLPFLSGLTAWVLLALIALSLAAGVPVPLGAVLATVAFWLISQLASRARWGGWRSPLLQRLVG
jgi:hypothetical protein